MKTMADLLGAHPFFAGLGGGEMALIAGCALNVHFAAGERIFREGDPASTFYLIRQGRVALEIHAPGPGRMVIDTIDDGDVLGWSWLVPPYRWFSDAWAVLPVSAVAIDGGCLREKAETDPRLGYELLKRVTGVMYERMQSARIRLLDVYGTSHV
jgi:CRP/FNR family transcriptional regulator, cyclic AMP receptor protein